MKLILSHIPAWLRNKYFLSLAGFIIWMLFFDPRDVYTQMERTRELKTLQASKQYYQSQIRLEKNELEQISNNPAMAEKYAREKYLMKRENEELFVIPEKP